MQKSPIAGAPVYYRDTGRGEALLLLHGGFSDGPASWNVQMRSLPEKHRLLVVDRRGHGRSPKAPRPYTIAGDAADALDVADRAGERRFHALGLSYGGLVALDLAVRVPERVLSLHLIEPPYLDLLPGDLDVRSLSERVREIRIGGRERGPEWIASEFFTAIGGAGAVESLRAGPAWPLIVRESGRLLDEEYAGEYPAALLSQLRLNVPVRVYTGGLSHAGLRKVAAELARRIQGSRLVEIPEADHGVQFCRAPFERELLAVTRGS